MGEPRVRALGPIEVRPGPEHDWVSPRPKQRALLALLLLHADRPVSIDLLADELWGIDLPRDPANQIQGHVTRLRRLLGDADGDLLRTRPRAYSLHVDSDVARFEDLAADGQFAEALALWRGSPFDDAPETPEIEAEAVRLSNLRLEILASRIDADLAAGRHAVLTAELQALVAENPTREGFWAQLMLALYRSGRQAEALEAYQRIYRILDDELGLRPGPALRELHQKILESDDSLSIDTRPSRIVPRQLPPAATGFIGRTSELDGLGGTPVTVIAGMGGIGKTALALQWAALHAEDFPDGQLYVNLRGYDADRPLDPATALEGFCRALRADDSTAGIPSDPGERESLFRSLVADRRMLILLDNARTVDQVRPLLAGTPTVTTLITSREDLAGLVARDGASRISLARLGSTEGLDLLREIVGADRVEAERSASETLIQRCDGLPLALRIAAERIQHRSGSPIADLVSDLGDITARLDVLETPGDPSSAVRAVFSWSYDALPPDTARIFRLLGVHPGPDLDDHLAANLCGERLPVVRRHLEHLVRAHLLDATGRRFQMHDLVRAYAEERALAVEPRTERIAALTRMLDYLTHTVHAAAAVLDPQRPGIELEAAAPTVPHVDFVDEQHALSWLENENTGLVLAIRHASTEGLHSRPWQLCDGLWIFHYYTERTDDWLATHLVALASARKVEDPRAEALTSLRLGLAYSRRDDFEAADEHAGNAVELFRRLGDRQREARALQTLGAIRFEAGRNHAAQEATEAAAGLYRELGDSVTEATAIGNLLSMRNEVGVSADDVELGLHALETLEKAGYERGMAMHLCIVSATCEVLGRYPEAADYLTRALEKFEKAGDHYGFRRAREQLGRIHYRNGDPAEALRLTEIALTECPPSAPIGRARILARLALLRAATGSPTSDVLDLTAEAAELAREVRHRYDHVDVELGLGETYAFLGRFTEAARHLSTALELAESFGLPYPQGQACHLLGRVAAASGDHDEAVRRWEQALAHLTEMGAVTEAEAVRALLHEAPGASTPD